MLDEPRSDPADARDLGNASQVDLASLLSIGMLSFRSQGMTRHSLGKLREGGALDCVRDFFIYFNEMTEKDVALAQSEHVAYYGAPQNSGIYGGFRAIAEHAKNPYVLILENDIIPAPGSDLGGALKSCIADMIAHDIKTFSMRSRHYPGQGEIHSKYIRCFAVKDPISPVCRPQSTPIFSRLKMQIDHIYLSKFHGNAIYVEKHPEQIFPRAIRKLPSGNYLTDSRFRNWSNQAVLVQKDFFLNVICRRVETHPDPRLLNGYQDIERALNKLWWRLRREPMGHAADGVFSHARIERS